MALQLDDLVYKLRIDDSELEAGSRSASQALGALNAPTAIAGRQMGALARDTKLTRQEMMALNFTVSDTIASLGSGMSPLTILLQQGPQVRDAFGGIGAALRGIGSLITPAVAGFGTLALVAGTAATAFVQGALQSDALEKALNRTGNAAGVTVGQLEAMVGQVAAATGATEGASRRVLLGLVQTGQVGPQVLGALATAATAVGKAYSMSDEEATKMFASMQKGVADWAAKHNESMNFITVEQYRYIRSLEDQGKATEAVIYTAGLAEKAAGRVTENLGALELAWRAVAREASGAWQSMLGIGKTKTAEQQLDELEALRDRMREPGPSYGGSDSPAMLAELAGIEVQISAARQRVTTERAAAAEQARAAAANRAAIEAERKAEEERRRRRAQPRERREFPSAIDDPALEQQLAFLRSERDGYAGTDQFIRERDERAAREAQQAAQRAERDRQQRIGQLMGASTFAQAQRVRDDLAFLSGEFDAGRVQNVEAYSAAVGDLYKRLDELERPAQKAGQAISTFADQAARNIQDGLGDTLQRTLEGNFEGIGRMWQQLLNRMVAQEAAARLGESMFGQRGPDGMRSGGWLDLALKAIGGFAGRPVVDPWGSEGMPMPGSPPRFAAGGNHAGGWRIVGERGPELEATGPSRIFNARDTAAILGRRGGAPVLNTTVVNHIDSRTDASQVQDLVARGVAEGHRMTLEQLRLEGVR